MQYKAGERVAFYKVTGKSNNAPTAINVGDILVDHPRGKFTDWEFSSGNGVYAIVQGKRLGFAIVDEDLKPQPTEKLQKKLDKMKAKKEAEDEAKAVEPA